MSVVVVCLFVWGWGSQLFCHLLMCDRHMPVTLQHCSEMEDVSLQADICVGS